MLATKTRSPDAEVLTCFGEIEFFLEEVRYQAEHRNEPPQRRTYNVEVRKS
jgi:hypothetical protein